MTVLNKHRLPGKAVPAGAVYIGRGSKWGNPFVIGVHGTRDEVCDKYEAYIEQRLNEGSLQLEDLAVLAGKDLVCFCKPLRCHGDYLARKAEWAAREKGQQALKLSKRFSG